MKTGNKTVMLYSVRNVTEVLLDILCSLFPFQDTECKDLLGFAHSNMKHNVTLERKMDFPGGFPLFSWIC